MGCLFFQLLTNESYSLILEGAALRISSTQLAVKRCEFYQSTAMWLWAHHVLSGEDFQRHHGTKFPLKVTERYTPNCQVCLWKSTPWGLALSVTKMDNCVPSASPKVLCGLRQETAAPIWKSRSVKQYSEVPCSLCLSEPKSYLLTLWIKRWSVLPVLQAHPGIRWPVNAFWFVPESPVTKIL